MRRGGFGEAGHQRRAAEVLLAGAAEAGGLRITHTGIGKPRHGARVRGALAVCGRIRP